MKTLLIGLTLFGSLSMRTPNDESFEGISDYEVSIGIKNDDIYLNRQWERQDGLKYIDDEFWFVTEPGSFYFRPQYINKESRNLKFTKYDLRYKPDFFNGLSIGYTQFNYDDLDKASLSIGYKYDKELDEKWSVSYMFDGYYSDSNDNSFDLENYLEFKYKINERLNLTLLQDYNNFRGIEFYKMKIGVEYELWM